MKLAIMQPYFFPYVGYFQLLSTVDIFIIYDDVNYIKQGWINRNRILLDTKPSYLTVELNGGSSFNKINETQINFNTSKLLKKIYHAYIKSPYFAEVFPLIEQIINYKEENLSKFVSNSIRQISTSLGINTKLFVSSDEGIATEQKGQDRVISICKHYNAKYYYNAIGGINLYSKHAFEKEGVELKFLKPNEIAYRQFNNIFIPNLSIIDLMMFNSKEELTKLLGEFKLL